MNKKIILYVILGLVVLTLVFFTIFSNMIYAIRDSGITGNSINSEDKCTPPEGVSVEDWRTHMGHHPEMYSECLN